jgi:hypothetical protein
MQQLAGIITENKARKMMKILNENIGSTDSVTLFDFPEDINDVDSYEEMGFKVKIEDENNGTYFASLSFEIKKAGNVDASEGHDWMSVLAILDDCENSNLRPNLEYDGKVYNFDEAYELVDSKAAGENI